jgi:hypothetical protein
MDRSDAGESARATTADRQVQSQVEQALSPASDFFSKP